ncbi:hypothetical protein GCM10010361_36350 [Streptomyces olivaceiscleroticus]|uniref:Uncharacterized protein n=1 Tax=Streptomyces olivaceiscleroticus TaxID=68245 RepID=A0ABN1A6N6_9ACTN
MAGFCSVAPEPESRGVPAGTGPLGRTGVPKRLGGLPEAEAEWPGLGRVGEAVAEPVLADGLGPVAVEDGEEP